MDADKDLAATVMQPMDIGTGETPRESAPGNGFKSGLLSKGGFVLVLLTAVVLVSLFAFPAVSSAESVSPARTSRPSDLGPLLTSVTADAIASGALMPIEVSDPVIVQQGGMKVAVTDSRMLCP